MYDDFPHEAEGLKFFLKATLVAAVGLVAFLFVANPMAGDASGTTRVTIVNNH